MKTFALLMSATLLILTGCNLTPEYKRPSLPVPEMFNSDVPNDQSSLISNMEKAIPWQNIIQDSNLIKIIKIALNNNRDIRIASLNMEKAAALYRIQRSELTPVVVAGMNAQRNRSGDEETYQEYAAGIGFSSWELDLFGRIRNLNKQAMQKYYSIENARKGIQISVVTGIATAYYSLAADRELQTLSEQVYKTQQDTYDIIRKSYEMGIASELDLLQTQSQMESAEITLSLYSARVNIDINTLNQIAGSQISESLLPKSLNSIKTPVNIEPGLSSEILLNRPDIKMAENQLVASNTSIGTARAAFFPRITLTAFTGQISSKLSNLFDSESRGWSFSPEVSIPLFDMGGRKANLKVAKTEKEIAVANYEKAIQSAFKEVKDALIMRDSLNLQTEKQQQLTNTLTQAFLLSQARFNEGIDGYLPVLVARRSQIAAKTQLVSYKLQQILNRVELYKVFAAE